MEVRLTAGTPHGHFRQSKHVTANKLGLRAHRGPPDGRPPPAAAALTLRLAVPLTSGSVFVPVSQRDDAPSGHSVNCKADKMSKQLSDSSQA